jgi:hypothetical protein
MKKHYVCNSRNKKMEPLVFDWDIESGEVSGPSAGVILEIAASGGVSIYPPPQYWAFGKEPLKDRYDMAAIIGAWHDVPEDLVEYYPGRFTPEPEDGVIY